MEKLKSKKMLIGVILAIVILFGGWLTACKINTNVTVNQGAELIEGLTNKENTIQNADQASINNYILNASKVSLAQYDKLKLGMTYTEVTENFGISGLMAQSGQVEGKYVTAYVWLLNDGHTIIGCYFYKNTLVKIYFK